MKSTSELTYKITEYELRKVDAEKWFRVLERKKELFIMDCLEQLF